MDCTIALSIAQECSAAQRSRASVRYGQATFSTPYKSINFLPEEQKGNRSSIQHPPPVTPFSFSPLLSPILQNANKQPFTMVLQRSTNRHPAARRHLTCAFWRQYLQGNGQLRKDKALE